MNKSPLLRAAVGEPTIDDRLRHVSNGIHYATEGLVPNRIKAMAKRVVIPLVIAAAALTHFHLQNEAVEHAKNDTRSEIRVEIAKQMTLQQKLKAVPELKQILADHYAKKLSIKQEQAEWLVDASAHYGDQKGIDGALIFGLVKTESGGKMYLEDSTSKNPSGGQKLKKDLKHNNGKTVVKNGYGAEGLGQVVYRFHKDLIKQLEKDSGKPRTDASVNLAATTIILDSYKKKADKKNPGSTERQAWEIALQGYNGNQNDPEKRYATKVLLGMDEIHQIADKAIYKSHDFSL